MLFNGTYYILHFVVASPSPHRLHPMVFFPGKCCILGSRKHLFNKLTFLSKKLTNDLKT